MRSMLGKFKTFFAVIALGATVATVGCGGTVAEPDDQAQAQQAVQRKGILGKVSTALYDLELRADQRKTVDSLLDDVEQKAEPIRELRSKIAQEVAQEVRAGKLDRSRIDPLLAELTQAAETLAPTLENAANKLHTTLDASQREDLIANIKEHKRGHEKGFSRGGPGKMKELAQELGLTDEQKDQIFEAIRAEKGKGADREAMREKFKESKQAVKQLAEAFVSESFDATSFNGKKRAGEMIQRGADRIIKMAEVALPILTPEQRGKLADHIEKRAQDMEE